jgi:hypothetical protein
MEIKVTRFISNNDATLSIVSIDGRFECFGLEDEYRETKVAAETRIPDGLYNISLKPFGGFHRKYKERFEFHEGMLHVQNVPGFEDILIHIGNTEKDTAGCLLVGRNANTNGVLTIGSSKLAYIELYQKVLAAASKGKLKIRYVDEDGR